VDRQNIRCLEGEPLGLCLLPELNDTKGFIAVDAAQINLLPGTVKVFESQQMDAV
jgi:Ni,Fe-hydrogenase maturation factor